MSISQGNETKQEVQNKLKALHADIDAGVHTLAGYTVRAAVDAWLAEGLSGRSARTVTLYWIGVKPLSDKLGAMPYASWLRQTSGRH